MPRTLLGLGANLGDRRRQLLDGLTAIAALPRTRLIARSRLIETAPIGGPGDQPAYLNAAATVDTTLPPARLLQELLAIEHSMGRQRGARWESRTLDLDVLCYGLLCRRTGALELPHPRMQYRRFVLQPASEVAPWAVHPTSGWTIGQLLRHLNQAPERIAIAATEVELRNALISHVAQSLRLPVVNADDALPGERADAQEAPPLIGAWPADSGRRVAQPGGPEGLGGRWPRRRPKLTIAVVSQEMGSLQIDHARESAEISGQNDRASPSDRLATGDPTSRWRRILQLPPTGPIAWIDADDQAAAVRAATAAIQSVWPALS